MKVKLSQAIKMFFENSSFEMVYFEAISNALDAEATNIVININMEASNKAPTLELQITDNGIGFDDNHYEKFSNLFDVDERSHKGLGRLVYLCYFDEIIISSIYKGSKQRTFKFSQEFDEKKYQVTDIPQSNNGTSILMKNYSLQKIAKNEYLLPKEIKSRILKQFYSKLFQKKQQGEAIEIKIKTTIDQEQYEEILSNNEIPNMELIELESTLNLYDKFQLYYSIQKIDPENTSLISAISVDNRTFTVDLIAEENIPTGFKMVFLLFSDYFTGKVDAARQNLTLTKSELRDVQRIFRKKVISLIEENVPSVKVSKTETENDLNNRYPHLIGYFDNENIGYIKNNDILKNAQDEFFKNQKELLEAHELSDEQFEKSIEISARALTEYILFRQMTIERLGNSTAKNSEAELHRLIVAKGKNGRFEKGNLIGDIYRNNSWLLDDKFMTYELTLSDRELGELVDFLLEDEQIEKDSDRPDFAFVFSSDPQKNRPFDVVIVELKKRGLDVYENMKTVNQLESRARKLMKYFKNRVQRIWYYGIIEFNEEIELALSSDFIELYSTGKLYYREKNVNISLNPKQSVPVGMFIWDINAIVNDANARNSTFLNFIKSKFAAK